AFEDREQPDGPGADDHDIGVEQRAGLGCASLVRIRHGRIDDPFEVPTCPIARRHSTPVGRRAPWGMKGSAGRKGRGSGICWDMDKGAPITVDLPDEAATARLAGRLAPLLRAGDMVA